MLLQDSLTDSLTQSLTDSLTSPLERLVTLKKYGMDRSIDLFHHILQGQCVLRRYLYNQPIVTSNCYCYCYCYLNHIIYPQPRVTVAYIVTATVTYIKSSILNQELLLLLSKERKAFKRRQKKRLKPSAEIS